VKLHEASGGDKLAKNCAGYDHPMHVKSLRRLIELIDSLRQWEVGYAQEQNKWQGVFFLLLGCN